MQLLVIKKGKEGLEKLLNNNKLKRFFLKILKKHLLILVLILSFSITAQEKSFIKGNEYILEEISVSGLKTFNEQTVVTYTGLRKGQKIRIPGEEISTIIGKLWKLDLFSDINFYLKNIDGDKAHLNKKDKEQFFHSWSLLLKNDWISGKKKSIY